MLMGVGDERRIEYLNERTKIRLRVPLLPFFALTNRLEGRVYECTEDGIHVFDGDGGGN